MVWIQFAGDLLVSGFFRPEPERDRAIGIGARELNSDFESIIDSVSYIDIERGLDVGHGHEAVGGMPRKSSAPSIRAVS